jgi:hypothetical protein
MLSQRAPVHERSLAPVAAQELAAGFPRLELLVHLRASEVDMSESLHKALDDKIVVTGRGKTVTGMEAFVQTLVDRVLRAV